MKRSTVVSRTLFSCLVLAASGSAYAQENAPKNDASVLDGIGFTANATLASQYRYRGLMQTNNKPAIQGGFDITHPSGLYFGNWNSNVSWLSDSNSEVSAPIEMDFYGGYIGKITPDISYDVGILQYYYPGDYPDGYTSPDTTEVYLGVGYGPVSFKYSHSLTNLFGFADSKNSQYYDLTGSFPTQLEGLTVDAHLGYQNVEGVDNGSYTDWSLGVTKAWSNGISTSLSYIDTNADEGVYTNTKSKYMGKATVLLSVSKNF